MKLTIRRKSISLTLLLACGWILSACTSLPVPAGDSPTPSATKTATPTIIWFPATNTPTPPAVMLPSPTQDSHPGVGELIFSDSFDQPDLWSTSRSDQASAQVDRSRLVLSITGAGPLSITSLRSQPLVADFFAEAWVEISLCSGEDQYGMIFRASPGENYYRFTINCNRQVRLERMLNGESYPLLDWLTSGDVPPGAPARVRLGVWANGRDLRFFLNDHFQFSLSDPLFSSGSIGFYVYVRGANPLTVAFSDLTVRSIQYIPPTPTPDLMPSSAASPTPNP